MFQRGLREVIDLLGASFFRDLLRGFEAAFFFEGHVGVVGVDRKIMELGVKPGERLFLFGELSGIASEQDTLR